MTGRAEHDVAITPASVSLIARELTEQAAELATAAEAVLSVLTRPGGVSDGKRCAAYAADLRNVPGREVAEVHLAATEAVGELLAALDTGLTQLGRMGLRSSLDLEGEDLRLAENLDRLGRSTRE